jgi:hypothetical protein
VAGSWGAGGTLRGAAKAAATASECLRQGEMRRHGKAIRKEQQAGRLRADIPLYHCSSKDGDSEREVGTAQVMHSSRRCGGASM